MNLLEETKILLNQYNLRAKKSFGQNFLINESIVDEIVEKSNITNEDVILEIGPGLGTLTKKLLKVAKKVIAVELDQDMCNILKSRINDENLEIINQDILKLDINEITAKYGKIKVVANLPYYITTPIIMKLLENNYKISTITVMVQKEVGERLVASPNGKDYSAITLSVNYYTKSEIIIDVPKENFLPSPKVDSVVVKLQLLDEPPVNIKEKEVLFKLIKAGFSQRRKTINNSLSSNGFDKEKISNILKELDIDSKKRAENLSLQDFANIANSLQ